MKQYRPRIGISSCLLGNPVRYDGRDARETYLADIMGAHVDWLPVCPEVECGMPVPRDAMRLVETGRGVRLITISTGAGRTPMMRKWIGKKIPELGRENLDGFVFKSRSPSSGMEGVNIHSASGRPIGKGPGMFAGAFMEAFPLAPCEDEDRLRNAEVRENFIVRVFAMSRWREYTERGISVNGLMEFHARSKYLIMSHSPRHYRELGRLAAGARKTGLQKLHAVYAGNMMEGLRLIATVKKNVNVLEHITGYFKRDLSSGEKAEILEMIERYRKGLVPLVVPVTLLNHLVRKYDQGYLGGQFYLNQSPAEMMLRNHA